MATVAAITGAKLPANSAEDSNNILPLLLGAKRLERHASVVNHDYGGGFAIRQGRWKLVAKGRTGKWELYDVEADRSELHNLANAQPKRAKEMADMWQAYAERANVIPWPNPIKKPDRKKNKKKR